MNPTHKDFLLQAVKLAEESRAQGGFPAGALVVKNNTVIGTGLSIGHKLCDPSSHGEMAAIRDACKNIQSPNLQGCILYTSMQPCLMCFASSMWAAIETIYYAIKQEDVSSEYYGGHYNVQLINKDLTSPLSLYHLNELEEVAMINIKMWESSCCH